MTEPCATPETDMPTVEPERPHARRPVGSVLALLVAFTMFVWLLGPQIDYDLWYDLRLGEYIAHSLSVPHHVMFLSSGQTYATPYYSDDEWAFCVFVWGLHGLCGMTGLAMFKAFLIVALGVVLYRTARHEGCGDVVAIGYSVMLIWMMRSRFMLRPQLLTDLFIAILIHLLVTRNRRLPWIVLPLFIVWANVHSGVLGGVALLSAWWAGAILQERTLRPARWSEHTRQVTLACALAWIGAMISPEHIHVFGQAWFALLEKRRSQTLIAEWDPLPSSAFLGALGLYTTILVFGLVATLWPRGSSPPATEDAASGFSLPRLLVPCAFFFMTFRHVRFIGELAAVGGALVSPAVQGWRRLVRGRTLPSPVLRAVTALLMVTCLVFLALDLHRPRRFDFSPPADVYPVAAIDLLRAHPPAGTLFNSYHFGGFLIWRGMSPFIDGINNSYTEPLVDAYLGILGDDAHRDALLQQFDIGACLVAWPTGKDNHLALIQALSRKTDWHLVQWDDAGLLFVRGTPPVPPYSAVAPALDRPFITADLQAAAAELDRASREAPTARTPRRLQIDLALEQGDLDRARTLCDALLQENADDYQVWMKRGVAEMRAGDHKNALEDLRRAAHLGNASAIAHFDLAQACIVNANAAREQKQPAAADALLDEAVRALREARRLDPTFAPAARVLQQIER